MQQAEVCPNFYSFLRPHYCTLFVCLFAGVSVVEDLDKAREPLPLSLKQAEFYADFNPSLRPHYV
jgi:hypothetical protein